MVKITRVRNKLESTEIITINMRQYQNNPLAVFSVILLLGIVTFNQKVTAFKCYKCNSNELKTCLEEPTELPASSTTDCEGYCTIVRTEYIDIPDEVITLIRNCEEEQPLVANGVRTENHYVKMYTSCDSELCNAGNGRRDPSDGDNYNGGPLNIIVVPESNSNSLSPLLALVAFCLLFQFRMRH